MHFEIELTIGSRKVWLFFHYTPTNKHQTGGLNFDLGYNRYLGDRRHKKSNRSFSVHRSINGGIFQNTELRRGGGKFLAIGPFAIKAVNLIIEAPAL